MNKKGSLELSVNAIVILIIALAILGLVIGFAVSKFRDVSGQIGTTEETPEATASQPIVLPGGVSTLSLEKNKVRTMAISVYNAGVDDVNASAISFTCAPSNLASGTFTAPAMTIAAGTVKELPVRVEVEGTEATGQRSCTMQIGQVVMSNSVNGTITDTVFVDIK
ncbi:hypothetical protein HN592_03560 [Candidatus Woesearchaeota archaeon]|jgi:hypothetical protein|nr:hypothetical protein [Candidatus Woesearchaeota archaeon]MBT4368289.1 hypothetical protein [Candidatus Woesearchaeota archaeon]MBT4712778.1 hypothetical protein [Candidatus Woesearchaeota archaeon]MBT6639690.1 hypothetical protein [Candidatus Woesearchaeota archaeon]MBT7133862.1 hypothetical protein [Candidatus Woesearchaeota archaeon]